MTKSGDTQKLSPILADHSLGIALIETATLRVHYLNPYLRSLLDARWHDAELKGLHVEDMLPSRWRAPLLALIEQVLTTGTPRSYAEVPFEGFLETRGRTYWRASLELYEDATTPPSLLITLADITDSVRSRLHLQAIHSITSALAGPSSLHLVLDRILQVLQDMFGSKRCAVILFEPQPALHDIRSLHYEDLPRSPSDNTPTLARIAAQQGLHPLAHDWHQPINEHLLLYRVIQDRRTWIIQDTGTIPQVRFPSIEYKGTPHRPGSALCVPIFELPDQRTGGEPFDTSTVFGVIEVYHRRARDFPPEEVALLEQIAQQVGLAIQNARLFRSIERLARVASRNARQKENVMQAIPDGVVICDPRWRVADINLAARQLLGWQDDVLGLPIQHALARSLVTFLTYYENTPDIIAQLEHRVLYNMSDEFKLIGLDGEHYTIQCTYTPIRDELGDTFAYIIIYHDVTQQVAARERIEAEVVARTAELKQRNIALQQAQDKQAVSNARLALLLERLPTGVILVSAQDWSIDLINQQAVLILQSLGAPLHPYSNRKEASRRAIGTNCQDLLRSFQLYDNENNAVPFESRPLYQALVQGRSTEAALHTTKPDGSTIHLLVNAAPQRAPDGSITSVILVYQEVTRLKNLERAREDFFTTMAHELKTPLANIRAHLSALLARDLIWTAEEQYDFLQTADEQVERLVSMINYFLDASRVEAGALRLELEPIIIPELFEDLQDRLSALITSSQRELRLLNPPDLPVVQGDYELVISVLSNLLSNAFRYTPTGGCVELLTTIMSDSQGQAEAVRFSVTDHGPGISPEAQATLFTRFSTLAALNRPSVDSPGQPEITRRHRASRWSPATGLGLYISRGIIEAHGSQLSLISSPGQGATFSFTLPLFESRRHTPDATTIQPDLAEGM